MASIEKTVFISYRRKDSYEALAVYQFLTDQGYDVFLDYESIPSGDFEQIIVSNIKARAHFILILTPTALDRCSQPGDWLRREIETAIDEKRNIVPLFFEDFSFGDPNVAKSLTGKLALIRRYNGLPIPAGYFMEAMERLVEKYLSVELDAVILPIPTEVKKVVEDAQNAANQALEQKKENIENVVKRADPNAGAPPEAITTSSDDKWWNFGGKGFDSRLYYGIGALILVVLAIAAINQVTQNGKPLDTPTPTLTERPTLTPAVTQEVPGAPNDPQFTATPVLSPSPTATATITPTATLGIGNTMTSEKDGMTLLYVPAGTSQMGSEAGNADESPVHTIELDAFWIDQTEITNEMYRKCVADGKCDNPSPQTSKNRVGEIYFNNIKYNAYPVINITWNDAVNYCTWAGRRLPTEAEWEKAAVRWNKEKQQNSIYPWGDSIECSQANYYGTRGGEVCSRLPDTAKVGNYPEGASLYGALDMAGNVWEWVSDKYRANYYQDPSVYLNPQGPTTSAKLRVARGGSWSDYDQEVRSANRSSEDEFTRDPTLGFRCVLTVDTPLP